MRSRLKIEDHHPPFERWAIRVRVGRREFWVRTTSQGRAELLERVLGLEDQDEIKRIMEERKAVEI